MKQLKKNSKKLLFLLLLFILATITLNAQITIRETNVIEKPILKPQRFDSLSNIAEQRRIINYKKYIGYKLFFLPRSKNYKPRALEDKNIINFLFTDEDIKVPKKSQNLGKSLLKIGLGGTKLTPSTELIETGNKKTKIYLPYENEKGEISTIPDSIEGKYFTIIDIKGGKYIFNQKEEIEYKKLEDIDLNENSSRMIKLKVKLKNESNKDTLNWIVEYVSSIDKCFFLVPYFEKQRNLYLNKNLILTPTNWANGLTDLVDVNTGAIVDIKQGEIWTCSDISFIDSKDSYYMECFVFLKNGEREVKIPLETYDGNRRNSIPKYFMLEEEFKKQELEKLKKEEEKKREEEQQKKQIVLQEQRFRKNCIAKWGQKMGNYIADGKVILGMNKEMCTAAWGDPIDINKTITYGFTTEQWVYGLGTYLYFEKGVLMAIQN